MSEQPGRSRWAQFRALSVVQRQVFIAGWLLLPLFWLGMRAFGLARFQQWLNRRFVASKAEGGLTLLDLKAVGEAVNIAARHTPFPATCLSRSLLLVWMLDRRGVACALRIGVRLQGKALDAHAWVEHDGVPINDQAEVGACFASFGDLVPATAFRTR